MCVYLYGIAEALTGATRAPAPRCLFLGRSLRLRSSPSQVKDPTSEFCLALLLAVLSQLSVYSCFHHISTALPLFSSSASASSTSVSIMLQSSARLGRSEAKLCVWLSTTVSVSACVSVCVCLCVFVSCRYKFLFLLLLLFVCFAH